MWVTSSAALMARGLRLCVSIDAWSQLRSNSLCGCRSRTTHTCWTVRWELLAVDKVVVHPLQVLWTAVAVTMDHWRSLHRVCHVLQVVTPWNEVRPTVLLMQVLLLWSLGCPVDLVCSLIVLLTNRSCLKGMMLQRGTIVLSHCPSTIRWPVGLTVSWGLVRDFAVPVVRVLPFSLSPWIRWASYLFIVIVKTIVAKSMIVVLCGWREP